MSDGRWDSIGPVGAESADTYDAGPIQPFQDTESIRQQGHGGMTPVEVCVHSWFRVSGADRFRCTHCGTVRKFQPYSYEP